MCISNVKHVLRLALQWSFSPTIGHPRKLKRHPFSAGSAGLYVSQYSGHAYIYFFRWLSLFRLFRAPNPESWFVNGPSLNRTFRCKFYSMQYTGPKRLGRSLRHISHSVSVQNVEKWCFASDLHDHSNSKNSKFVGSVCIVVQLFSYIVLFWYFAILFWFVIMIILTGTITM